MQQVLVLGGGASGLAAALAAARAGARVTVLERNAKPGKKLLATGNGRCNLDNTGIAPERYFTSDPAGLKPLLAAVNAADPLGWFESLGLYTRTDEAGRVYPYSNQAADVLALLEHHLEKYNVRIRCGCTVRTLSQSRGGYAVQFVNADGQPESLRTDAVICAMGAAAGPQFGTDGFGTTFAAQCGGKLAPLYPCLTALQIAKPQKALAGIRAKATASLLDGKTLLAAETGEVQFTDYGLSGICIMQLSGLLAPGRGPKQPAVELDLFPALDEAALAALFAARPPRLAGDSPAEFWLGLVHPKLGRALWAAARLPETSLHALPPQAWQTLARTAKHWRFEGANPPGREPAPTPRRRAANPPQAVKHPNMPPPCYRSETRNPYPLCLGWGMKACAHCCLWTDYDSDEDESRVTLPLSLAQLQEMDGTPAWWECGPEYSCWGIIAVDSSGRWEGIPFFQGRWREVNFVYNSEARNMEIYRHPPYEET